MSTIIDFTAILNARRAAEVIAERQERQAEAMRTRAADAVNLIIYTAETLPGITPDEPAAAIAAAVREPQEDARPVPAYCDPHNEVRGSKYDATRHLSPAELAARIRADIKDAIKTGRLPAGLKASVRKRSYSGGFSIDVRVVALPPGMLVYNPRFLAFSRQNPHELPPFRRDDQYDAAYLEMMARLETIRWTYNRDNSDSMTDYFDVRYHGAVDLDYELNRHVRETEAR